MISQDALLADTKLIAEPWDAAGLYEVGTFPGGPRWSGWNGRYRDDVRRFRRGDPGMTSALATRLCGSDDLYHGRGPLHSINFITCLATCSGTASDPCQPDFSWDSYWCSKSPRRPRAAAGAGPWIPCRKTSSVSSRAALSRCTSPTALWPAR
jgi:hypothetical protein